MTASLSACVLSVLLCGAITADTGREPWYWDSHSVVYGTVEKVEGMPSYDRNRTTKYRITFRPRMTLTGKLDCAVHPLIHPTCTISQLLTAPPGPGNFILVLNKEDNGWVIPNQGVTFVPGAVPVLRVTGLRDPLVDETIDLLQEYHRENRRYLVRVVVKRTAEGKKRGISAKQIEERVKARIAESNDIFLSEIQKLPFSSDDPTPLSELATVDIQLYAPTGMIHPDW